jgi:tripartite-type tricarboxylate transporter receptor subunit TctC
MTRALTTLFGLVFTAVAITVHAADAADAYPTKPIRLVVPAPPGGTIDPISRLLAEAMSRHYGQNVVVDNRPGANFNVGMEIVAKSPPNGYTLVVASSGALATNIHLYRKLPFDPVKDFEPIILYGNVPNVLVVNPSLPPRTLKEFIEYAKANPNKLNFGSTGNGSSMHLAGELFKSLTGTQMTHVPYVNPGIATQDLLSGRIQLMFQLMTGIEQYVKAGKVYAIAVAAPKRSPALPNVPTAAEAGLKGFESSAWFGILAPKGTPKPTVAKLNHDLNRILADPAFNKRLLEMGVEPMGGSVTDFERYLAAEIKKWGEVVRISGARLD